MVGVTAGENKVFNISRRGAELAENSWFSQRTLRLCESKRLLLNF